MKPFALALFLLLLASSLVIQSSASVPSTRTPIKHVIFIMKENHSFDNYFELYPEGINGSLLSNPIVRELSRPYVAPLNTSVPVYPGLPLGSVRFSLSTSAVQQNPGEGWVDYHGDWDYGRMDGWVAYSGPQSMVYLSERQLSAYWDYAEEYVLFDNWFSPAMTETLPNRLFSLAGIAPVSNDYGPPPYVPLNQTIFYQLTQHDVSWGYYELFSTVRDPPASEIYPLDSIEGFSSSPMMEHVMNISVFYQQARNGSLPSVCFVMPFGLYGEDGYPDVSEHPPANVTVGELWTESVVNAVMRGPDWWSSAIFVTWDECGGFYDNVPPPQVNPFGYGERVPALLISPYAKENYVDDQVLNHMSVLAFIDYNWGLPYLSKYVEESGVPLSAFDFAVRRAPIVLRSNATFPIPLQIPLVELNYSSPPYSLPSSSVSYQAPPSWMPGFQLVAGVASILALGLSRKFRVTGKAASLLLSGLAALLGFVYPAIPPPPAPPGQPTESLLTFVAAAVLFASAVVVVLPLAKRQRRALRLSLMLAVGALALWAALTPGVLFSPSGPAPSDLAPPPTLVGTALAVTSPVTKGAGLLLMGELVVTQFERRHREQAGV